MRCRSLSFMKSLILIGLTAIFVYPTQTRAQVKPPDKSLESYKSEVIEYRRLGRHEVAVGVLRQVTHLSPDDHMAHYFLGVELNALGSFLEASESLLRAIQLKPTAEARRELCVACHNLKQYSQAVESCTEAVRLKPDFAIAYHDLGMSLFELRRPSEAIEAIKQAIKLKLDFAEAHDSLGYVHYRLGDLKSAVKSLKEAIKINPGYAEAHNDLAIVLYQMHRYQEVVDLLHRATKLKPNYSQAYFNLGVAHAALKNRDAALETYRKLLSFDGAMARKLFAEVFKEKVLVVRSR